jgi:hypothetical protein
LSNLLDNLPVYEGSKIRESRDENNKLSFLRANERLSVLQNLDLIDLQTQKTIKIKDIF